ncbi:acyl-CoA thioesterase-1 [Novosphingobium kunmingense]|uniref:Acyl-CoA thioesterase-1 n=1 Tax=Novosphingobium kunmingense TaxID=1211806 RepID=A0A2N0HL67_9SPHN|nr:arylesterase [Novosphingobium kunmingense]PKB19615.1 acyl-CoA thioesterase-1 [Novosphingobium kunmingense]
MKWNLIRVVTTPVALALALAACGSEAPVAAPTASASADEPPLPPVMGAQLRVIALGDSLFAGYGLDPGQSYPARLETALRGRGINAKIMNAGVSGNTTADGLQRLDFTLNSDPAAPALVLISLGGNDMLRGLPPEQTRSNLEAILARLQERKVPVVLMGMIAAPNLGPDYAAKFNPIFPTLAKKYGAALVPFFLQPLLGKPGLIQPDRIHPTAEGIDLMVGQTVEAVARALPAPAKSSAP